MVAFFPLSLNDSLIENFITKRYILIYGERPLSYLSEHIR
ncbi:MAG: hypothetical protein ACI9VL_000406, partial [Colwellia sp.]